MKFKSLFIFISVILFFTLSANSQVGIQLGYVNSVDQVKVGNVKNDSKAANGFNVGITYDVPLTINFSFKTGLLYSMLMGQENYSFLNSSYKTVGHYLTLPLNLAFGFPLGDNMRIFAYGGPNLVVGIAGKNKLDTSVTDVESDWYGDDSHRKRFDVQLGVGLGLQISILTIKAGYDWGMINLTDLNNTTWRRNQFTASLGFLF